MLNSPFHTRKVSYHTCWMFLSLLAPCM